MKLGIDVGNYQVKTSTGVIFDSRVETETAYGSVADVLELDGSTYRIGEGNFDIEARKFDKDSYEPLLVTAICKSTDEEIIDLGLGLPVLQYRNKDNIKELISKFEGKSYELRINSHNRQLKIRSVGVYPEGVAGFIYLLTQDDQLKAEIGDRDVVVVDIGGKTTDIALLRNKRAVLPDSVDVGTIDIYDTIAKELRVKYYDGKIENEKIQDYLDKGFYYRGTKQDISFATKKVKDLFDTIYSKLKLNYPITTEAVVIIGGGARLLGGEFKRHIPNVILRTNNIDDILCNANAFKELLG